MGHLPLIEELAMIAMVSVCLALLFSRVKLPAVAGFLVAGALIGPFGWQLVTSSTTIHSLAEIGVVFLLFTIGLEFSFHRLRHMMKLVMLGGFLQVSLTILFTLAITSFFAIPLRMGLFYGFIFSLSSTAIVLRALEERRELETPHGRFIMGTLVFQDLCVVPMVLAIPFLADKGSDHAIGMEIFTVAGKAIGLMLALFMISRFLVPRILKAVDATQSREAFLLSILSLCLGTAWLSSQAGLSIALGAFLGGVVVADTHYGHRAMGDILPLRDAFVSIFFISLGMLFDINSMLDYPQTVAWMLFGFIFVKGLVATLAAMVLRMPARVAWLAGVGLAQFGEFGFVLTQMAEKYQLLDAEQSRPLLAAGFLSMFLTPILLRVAPHIRAGERILAPLEKILGLRGITAASASGSRLTDHVVIVGFGLAGRRLAESLSAENIPYIVLELNADLVLKTKKKVATFPIFYADATSREALGHAHLSSARMLVLLIDDAMAAQRVIKKAKEVAPHVPISMRTRYQRERHHLLHLGAQYVVAEELAGAKILEHHVLEDLRKAPEHG